MKHSCWFLPFAFFIAGCLTSNGLEYEAISDTNQYHLARVRKGMSEKQVLQIMHKPYSYETFQVDDDIYDVWFYVIRPIGLDQTRMVPQNLTPLTFKNGVLVGTGYNWYYYAMKEQVAEAAAQIPEIETPKTQEAEDKKFEKDLKTYPKTSAPSQDKAAPTKKAPEDQNLPPNVHIISQNEAAVCESCEEPLQETPCASCQQAPCDPCAGKECGPTRFSVLSKGMTESQVFRVFGEPMKHETFQIGYHIYDAWFYDTIGSPTAKPSIIPQNQTILTFKNAVLISLSDEDFYELKKQAEDMLAEKQAPAALEAIPPPMSQKKTIFKPYVPKAPLGAVSKKEFSKVYKGMRESEVMKALGGSEKQDTFMIGEDTYNIWFYEVGKKNAIIPLTFKNGILVGMTADEYNSVKDKAGEDRIDGYDEEGERMEEDESEQNFNYW